MDQQDHSCSECDSKSRVIFVDNVWICSNCLESSAQSALKAVEKHNPTTVVAVVGSPKKIELPNYGLSGKRLFSVYIPSVSGRGVAPSEFKASDDSRKPVDPRLKYSEPVDAAIPLPTDWRIYVYRNNEEIDRILLQGKSYWLIGRDVELAQIAAIHPSVSGQHCVIQFRRVFRQERSGMEQDERYADLDPTELKERIVPYLIDLESTNGTMVNGESVSPARYMELRDKDVLQFAHSSRQYVLMYVGDDI